MSYRSGAARVAGFAVLPMLGAVTPLLALPAITSTNGAEGWTAVAVGQSVGAGGSVLVELGWALTGPQAVAASDAGERRRLFTQASASKAAALVVVAPVVMLVAALLATQDAATAVISAAAICIGGLSPTWYFIGEGRPRSILFSDALPRVVFTLAGVALLYAGSPLWAFALCSAVGYAASFAIGSLLVGRHLPWGPQLSARAIGSTLASQRMAVSGRGLSALYIGLPTSLVQAVSPASVATFAAAERLVRMGLLVLQSVPHAFQGYLGAGTGAEVRRRRAAVAVACQAAIGLVAAAAVVLALPTAVDLLLSGTVSVPTPVCWLAAGVAFLTCLSRGTGLALVSTGDVRWITASALAGAVVGVAAVPGLAVHGGATGAMAGLLLAELAVACVQGVTYWRTGVSSPVR